MGQTRKTPDERFRLHKSRYKSLGGTRLYKSMQEYGTDKFKYYTLESNVELSQLNEREQYWILKLNTYNKGLNGNKGENRRETNTLIDDTFYESLEVYLNKDEHQWYIIGGGILAEKFGVTKSKMVSILKELNEEGRINNEFIRKSLTEYGYILPYNSVDPNVFNMDKFLKLLDGMRARKSVEDLVRDSGIKVEIVRNILRGKRHKRLMQMYIVNDEISKIFNHYGYRFNPDVRFDWYKKRKERVKEVGDLWLNTYYTRSEIGNMTGENNNYIGKVISNVKMYERDNVIKQRGYVELIQKLGLGFEITDERFAYFKRDLKNKDLSVREISNKYGLDYEVFRGVLRTKWGNNIDEIKERKTI